MAADKQRYRRKADGFISPFLTKTEAKEGIAHLDTEWEPHKEYKPLPDPDAEPAKPAAKPKAKPRAKPSANRAAPKPAPAPTPAPPAPADVSGGEHD